MKGLIDLSLVNGVWTLKLSMIQTVALAIVTLYLGEFIKKHSSFLQKVCMPAPAIGGLPFAFICAFLSYYKIINISFESSLQSFLMLAFFTTIGLMASLSVLKKGGIGIIIFWIVCTAWIVVQNAGGIIIAKLMGIHPIFGIMAGSVCPESLMRRVVDEMNMKEITICYGLTEGSPVMTQSDIHDPLPLRCETVGCAMPGIEVRVADPDTCEELPRGQVGEIICRGYNVMKGYYKMPEETAKAISPDGWLHSGDLGVMDENGYVRVTGRIKDMIIRGGENVYPREVEEFLLEMPGVLDVQVVAVPSRKYGEEVGAFLIPRPGVELAPEDVRAFCRGKIAWYKVPKYVAVISGFPLTASGKIQKYKLREMAAERWPEAMQK